MISSFLVLAQAEPDNAAHVFFGLGAVGLIVAILAGLFWLWMLVDALTNPGLDSTMKVVWALVIFFFPFLGALIYLLVGRGKRTAPV